MPESPVDYTRPVAYVKGYPSLAAFIASDRDKSTSIYRRFDRLSARNLLYLQSELVELEAQQDQLDAEDLRGSIENKKSARSWQSLQQRASTIDNVREKERLRVVKEIREKIKEYREALLLDCTLLSYRRPNKRTLEAFRNNFHNVGSPIGEYPTLGDNSERILDDANDLIALRTPQDDDRLTSMLRRYLAILFVTKRTDSPLAYFSEERLHIVVTVLNVLVAAVLLFGAILNLYLVVDEQKRLGLIAGYTIAFATCIGLVTKAKRSEVFGASAAYTATLVVFVSGNLGSSGVDVRYMNGNGTASRL